MDVIYLFVPTNRPERFAKALGSGAYRIILNLEDAVKPGDKSAARDAISDAYLDWARVVVWINDATAPAFTDDLVWLAGCRAGSY
jgi:citrate lyase subunit beta/citryl-CoA lyase